LARNAKKKALLECKGVGQTERKIARKKAVTQGGQRKAAVRRVFATKEGLQKKKKHRNTLLQTADKKTRERTTF